MRLHFLGTGDAFGTGGRFQSCLHVTTGRTRFLVDCGASSMIALRRGGIDPTALDAILLTHLHGDHFGGLPFLLLDAQLASRRRRPLTILGPIGTVERLGEALEVFFPGSSKTRWRFDLDVREMPAGAATRIAEVTVIPYEVVHPSGAPAYALRIEAAGKVVTCSGDTEWTDALVSAAERADLFICECYTVGRKVPYHMDYDGLLDQTRRLTVRRILVTHMGQEVLTSARSSLERAEDGLVIEI